LSKHLYLFKGEEDLKELTEEWLEELSSQSQLSQNQMNSIKDDLIKIFQDNQINSIDT
jgi:site-specific recombinase XerD